MVEVKTKRKPPAFNHLPINRAKKLKQTWVRNTKIKSKWKAEKRKQAHGGLSSLAAEGLEDEEDGNEALNETGIDKFADAQVTSTSKSAVHPSRVRDEPNHTQISGKVIELTGQSTSSLRDLTREAYSPSSLHTYRSDPLNRRGGRGGRGQGRGRIDSRQRRGQPNMKLRMGAMLEKIKHATGVS